MNMANWVEKPTRPQPYTKLGAEEQDLPWAEHTTYTSNITWTQQVIFGNTYVYTNTHLHVITTDGKEAMSFK